MDSFASTLGEKLLEDGLLLPAPPVDQKLPPLPGQK